MTEATIGVGGVGIGPIGTSNWLCGWNWSQSVFRNNAVNIFMEFKHPVWWDIGA